MLKRILNLFRRMPPSCPFCGDAARLLARERSHFHAPWVRQSCLGCGVHFTTLHDEHGPLLIFDPRGDGGIFKVERWEVAAWRT